MYLFVCVTSACTCIYVGGLSDCWQRGRWRESQRDDERQGTDPWDILLGQECSKVVGSTSRGLEGGGFGETREEAMRMGYTKHGGPIHENQMKGGLDDSLGAKTGKKRGGRKRLIKPSEFNLNFSIIGSVCARCLVVWVLVNVLVIGQHVYCISLDGFNLWLTKRAPERLSVTC